MAAKQELLVPETHVTSVAVPDLQNRLIDLASDKDFKPETLRALIEMKERSEDRSAREQFNAAFAEMQPEIPEIAENGAIVVKGERRSKYSRWEDMKQVITPILHKHGFALNFRNSFPEPGKIEVTAILRHKSGHSEENPFRCKADDSGAKNDIQALGSSQSYAMRYATIGLLNITTRDKQGRDDDGERSERPKEPEGYEKFKAAMEDAAMIGQADATWKAADPVCRKFCVEQDRTWYAEVKRTNGKAAS